MGQDEYDFREAGDADFDRIAEFFAAHKYGPKQLNWSRDDYLHWLKWKYRENPDGPARSFVAEDAQKTIVGIRSDLPRQLTSAKTGPFMVSHALDVLVDAKLRKQGVYSKLLDFVLDTYKTTRMSFPNKPILHVSLKYSYRSIGPMDRWSFPIALGGTMKGKPYALLAPLADMAAKLYATVWLGRCPRDIRMEPVARFTRGFDVDTDCLHGVRSTAYLNWRFIDNPMYSYSTFEFFESDECIGFCAYSPARSDKVELYDFVVSRRQRSCLRVLIEHFRSQGITHLRYKGLGLHMGKFGFTSRKDPTADANASKEIANGPWLLTLGDRDY